MQAIEYFEVECTEKAGGENYKQIANDVLLDHNLLRVVHKIHIYIDPKVPIFVAVGILKKVTTIVKVGDIANVNPLEGKITLSISDETYLSQMLKVFWDRFGKDHVEQPDRFTVILYNVPATAAEIEEIQIADPSQSLYKDLVYAMKCICPEGFRVRSEDFGKEKFSFVASEDTLTDASLGLVNEKFALMGETP
ncbi:methanogenesis marker 17 protein [Methanoregula sp. UBA64]|uniref:methanogenesis marker 17 protein n=1 Tax=Methanoregula sp. UBA64 TaxID=1915554 RepID=UPI0025F7662C|nr:methanogenesis marker 17 protein [Methanoregula sp. UBA64]